jgi:asparagine synthase (glutamine-hydrolysing)
MCGIAGIVRYDRPATALRELVRAMQARLAHRGPDGGGEHVGSYAALAHTRLAMVDADNGAQPMSDGRYTIVYNGELYNHDALRARLPGPWRTRCDTETVLAAWRAWGEACIDELDGMFALFVWDEVAQAGVAARDRLGVKPLAYTLEHGFAFASEAHALVPVLGRARGNREAIVEYLVAPAFSGVARSPFEGVRYLQPGHILRVSRQGVSTRRYWRWQPSSAPVEPGELREAFDDAVRGALRSDAPLGVFLSGGVDSTAIAAAARLPTWSITFDGQADWHDSRLVVSDDTPFARLAASELCLAHHEVAFDRASVGAEIAAVARVDDALPAWEQELSQRALARAASRVVKGVLVGDAADETHYGYHFLLDAGSPRTIVDRLGSVPVRDPDALLRLDDEYRAIAGEPGVAGITRLIVERWLPRLLHDGDIHCMAFGLEARVPFAANRLVEVAARIPPERAAGKAMLREAMRGRIPEAIRTRRKSALPKDQATGAIYRELARDVARDPHPIVRELVAVDRLPLDGSLDEPARACLFRVIALHHWAIAHGVS